MLNLGKLKHLKHIGKISKHLGDIAFELKWLRDLIEKEIDRKEGNFLAADTGEYDHKHEFNKEQGKEIEDAIKEILDIDENQEILAATPMQVYTAEPKQ